MYIIRGPIKTEYKDKNQTIQNPTSKNPKSKIEKLKIQNRNFSKCGPNLGADERPKGEPVAVGDLKASKTKFSVRNQILNCKLVIIFRHKFENRSHSALSETTFMNIF